MKLCDLLNRRDTIQVFRLLPCLDIGNPFIKRSGLESYQQPISHVTFLFLSKTRADISSGRSEWFVLMMFLFNSVFSELLDYYSILGMTTVVSDPCPSKIKDRMIGNYTSNQPLL